MRSVPLLSHLGDDEIAALLDACLTTHLSAGAQVFSPLESADSFYVILEGRAKVYKLSPRGDEQILHLYGPGNTFGEAAMWARISYPAHAEVLEDTTLLVVKRSVLKRLITDNPDIAMAMMAGMSAKLREFNQLIEQLSLREVPARLANVLLELPAKPGTNTVVLQQTKRELAGQIGTVAETLSRALKKLSAAGLIEVNGPEITILDPDGLAELADG
jgi:CRP/FNR family transcriptional regulator